MRPPETDMLGLRKVWAGMRLAREKEEQSSERIQVSLLPCLPPVLDVKISNQF